MSQSIQHAPFFSVMVDETTDAANIEQVVICLRWVSETLAVHEDFIGLYEVASTGAQTIYFTIKDILLRLNLPFSKVRGQCYDGAATMTGCKFGVATRMNADEPRAIFTHCYGHSLNLVCCDTIKQSKLMQDALDTTHEITKLIKKSPGREATFKSLRCETAPEIDVPGIRLLCPTRWTVRADSLNSILENYSVLVELWSTAFEHTEMNSRIQGVAAQMATVNFYFSSTWLLMVRHADNLSKSLQTKDMSAADGLIVVANLFISEKVKLWTSTILNLSLVPKTQPYGVSYAAYSASVHGVSGLWTFFLRTILDISSLLQPLEDAIRLHFISSITGRDSINDIESTFCSSSTLCWSCPA